MIPKIVKVCREIYEWSFPVVIVIMLLTWFFHMFVFHRLPRQTRRMLEPGIGLVFTQDREYLSSIDEVLASGSNVYVLYRNLPLVKVYNTDGDYVCSYAAKGHQATMYVRQNTLYLRTSMNGLTYYEFTDQTFVRSYIDDDAHMLSASIRQDREEYLSTRDEKQNRYSVKGQSIVRIDSNGVESVFVKRSPLYFLATGHFFALVACLFILLALLNEREKRNLGSD